MPVYVLKSEVSVLQNSGMWIYSNDRIYSKTKKSKESETKM